MSQYVIEYHMLDFLRMNEREIGYVSSAHSVDDDGHLIIGVDGGIDLTALAEIARTPRLG